MAEFVKKNKDAWPWTMMIMQPEWITMSSKPLSAGQARTYHAREFASERQNYWSRDQQGFSEWQGRLAQQWGLEGAVGNDHFARLSEGQHPFTEAQIVKHCCAQYHGTELRLEMRRSDGNQRRLVQ